MKTFIIFAIMLGSGSFCMQHPDVSKKSDDNDTDKLSKRREIMVKTQIQARGVKDLRVLDAMQNTPRHEFVPESERKYAYDDNPLPIGHDQTISQPYIVAYMTEQLNLSGEEKALEVGTGSGYQAAVLSQLVQSVYTIEIVEPLCKEATRKLSQLGYNNIHVKCGDGYSGWPENAPFDVIIVTAAPKETPPALIQQLKAGGRLIIPVGTSFQQLVLIEKGLDGTIKRQNLIPVRFVPMTGKAVN